MFACLCETNFPNIPFSNPTCFNCWLFPILLCLYLFSCSMFLLFCFMLALLLVCYYFVVVLFLFCFLICFQTMKKHCFPCNSSVFSYVGKRSFILMVYDFVLVFLVLFVCNLNNEVALFCVCVVCFLFVTRLSGFLVCILWSCFFFVALF